MKSIFASALALAVLATPFASAVAAPSQPNEVHYNDLDLETAAGKKTLDTRVRSVARRVCEGQERTGTRLARGACIDDVRRQVLSQIESNRNRVGKGG